MTNNETLCPVCGKFYFSEVDSDEICEVCGWQDDKLQKMKPDYSGGANVMSLNEAKQAYKEGRAIE